MKKLIFFSSLLVNIFPASFCRPSIVHIYNSDLNVLSGIEDTTHLKDALTDEKMYAFGFDKEEKKTPKAGFPDFHKQEKTDPVMSYPCSPQAFANGLTITNFFKTQGYQARFNDLMKANVPGIGREYAAVCGIDNNTGLPAALPVITTSGASSVSINVNPPGLSVTAIVHTHPDNVFPAPSAGDLYAFGNYAQFHPGFLYYTLAFNNSNYVLMVTDSAELVAFLKSYPQNMNIEPDSLGNPGRGANYKMGSKLYETMREVATAILLKSADPDNPTLQEMDIAQEAVQVYILDHYKTGMALLKQDSNGNFNEIHSTIDGLNKKSRVVACN